MAAGGHFGCPKITFDLISIHFTSIQNFNFFCPKFTFDRISGHFRSIGHFGCPKFTLDHISGHFRSTQIFIFFTKWLLVAILDVQKSLSISFLSISHRYRTLFCFQIFDKMADVGHFGCPKFTFDRISGHFRSIGHFGFPKFTFLIAILAISDRYRIFFFGGHFGCLKITLDRISGHFRLIGHFGCPQITFDRISGHFRSIRNFFFEFFLDKMAAGGHFGFDDNVNYRTRPRYLDE